MFDVENEMVQIPFDAAVPIKTGALDPVASQTYHIPE
jgi:hypothetical protein